MGETLEMKKQRKMPELVVNGLKKCPSRVTKRPQKKCIGVAQSPTKTASGSDFCVQKKIPKTQEGAKNASNVNGKKQQKTFSAVRALACFFVRILIEAKMLYPVLSVLFHAFSCFSVVRIDENPCSTSGLGTESKSNKNTQKVTQLPLQVSRECDRQPPQTGLGP